jgi:hypothetical protein
MGSSCSFDFYFQLTRKRKSLQVKVQPKKATQPKKGTQPAKEETSDDSSDESSSDDVSVIHFLLGSSSLPIRTYILFN